MINKVFGSEYVDEEYQFKKSLFVFVSTYLLHCIMYVLVKVLPDAYMFMWQYYPFITECLFIFCQLIYDVLPLTMIFRQHHNHFKTEDMESTTFIMRSSSQIKGSTQESMLTNQVMFERLTGYKGTFTNLGWDNKNK